MKSVFTLLTITIALTGCAADINDAISTYSIESSPGESNSDSQATVPLNLYTESTLTESGGAAESVVSATGQILVTDSFIFETTTKTPITLDIPSQRGIKSYLSLCPDYISSASGFEVDYRQCVMKTRIDNGRFAGSIHLPNQYKSVLGIVWPLTPGAQPLYREIFVVSNSTE